MEFACCRLSFDGRRMTKLLRTTYVFLLWLVYVYADTTTRENTPTPSSTTQTGPSKASTSGGLDRRTIITLSVTFPVGIVVGVAWCWCMSKVCGTGQRPPKARLNHSLTHVQRVHRTDSFDE